MGSDLRIGGTLEISQFSSAINQNRIKGISRATQAFFPKITSTPENYEIWHGFRPCSPDGLPYIGKIGTIENAYVNAGHAMMGMSLGPASGKLISQLINQENLTIPIELMNPNRFQ
jgi:D-amino-acid dehydrogenase